MLLALQGAWPRGAIAFSGSIGAGIVEWMFLKNKSTVSHQIHNPKDVLEAGSQ
jgi:hypothetical protein